MQSASTNITTFPGKVGISNANPTHTLAIGSNVYVDDTGSNKLTVTGIISGDGLGVSNIQTTNVLGLSDNVTRIATLETDLGDNSSRISTVSTDLGDNSSRITTLESGDISISGDKTFTGDVIFESNIHMNGGNVLVANTVNLTVSDPIIELGSNNSGTNDLGIIMTRPNNNSNVAVVFDESDDTLRMGYTLNGASDSIIDLDSNALAVNVQGELTVGSKLDVSGDINFTGSLLQNGSAFQGSQWTESNSNIYYESNVAIGTSSVTSGARLEVDGTLQLSNGVVHSSMTSLDLPGTVWTQQVKKQASDAQLNDFFGSSVALSSDGTYAISGAIEEDTAAYNAGAAYVFIRSGTTWTQQAKLTADDAQASDAIANQVALNSDATYAVVGAWASGSWAGAAYVFIRSGTTWTQQQKLVASDAQGGDSFGNAVAIDADGDTVIVSAGWDDNTGGVDAGSAYVFTRSGTTWTQQQKLMAGDAQANDLFGTSVAIDSDGSTAIIAAMWAGTGQMGAAYVFTRSGTTWSEQQKLTVDDAHSSDNFGRELGITSDGNKVVVGAPNKDNNNGASYVFTRSGATWTQQQKLMADDAQAGDQLGYSVRISQDGNYIICGAVYENTGASNEGAFYIFLLGRQPTLEVDRPLQITDGASNNVTMSVTAYDALDWTTPTTWSMFATGSTWVNSGHANSGTQEFGESIDISSDGTYAVVGARAGPNWLYQGVVYVYIRSGTSWTQQAKLTSSNSLTNDYFGDSVAINKDGTYLAVSASGESVTATYAGSVYIFTRSGTSWSQQQKLGAPSGATANDWTGVESLAIDDTGERVIVGSQANPSLTYFGAAWVYKRSGTSWSQEQKLTASDGTNGDNFGISVAMSGDGETCVVGAASDGTSSTTLHGSVYVFTRSGTTWTETAKLLSDSPTYYEFFGHQVAIEGNTIAVGANVANNFYSVNPPMSGRVYIFTRPNANSSTWTQQQKIQASDGHPSALFGNSCDLSGDGDTLFVGAPYHHYGPHTATSQLQGTNYRGTAYVFTRTGTVWLEKLKLDTSIVSNSGYFGKVVRVSGDGRYIITGAGNTNSGKGRVFIYTAGTRIEPRLNMGGAGIVTQSGVTASAFLTSSDIRLKENIQEYSPENLLDKLRDVQVITYTNKPLNDSVARTETQIGLSAQNILTLFPEYVDDSDTYYKMNYSKWPVLNTLAIKELTIQLQAEKAKVADLLARVKALENA